MPLLTLCRSKKSLLKQPLPNQSQRKLKLNKIILGIDEVGRGPWAGPLVIGAVILGPHSADWINQLTDSKKLTAKKRAALSPIIQEKSLAYGLGWVSTDELDCLGLSRSLRLAARRAIKQVLHTKTKFDEIVIDGTINFLQNTPLSNQVTLLKKADFLVKEVSAASIIAKVARDNYMIKLAETYPEYGFEKHVGYGTAAHKQALLKYGVTPEHRKSFRPIQEILANSGRELIREPERAYEEGTYFTEETLTTSTDYGQAAEKAVAQYLTNQDHNIIAHNFKTKDCEIDLISIQADKIYFTEVKYRQNPTHGTPIDQITPQKFQQMNYAAQEFLTLHPEFNQYQPILAAASVSGVNFQIDDWFPII